jgi:hypothetical protein
MEDQQETPELPHKEGLEERVREAVAREKDSKINFLSRKL